MSQTSATLPDAGQADRSPAIDWKRFADVDSAEIALRFAFGASISAVAAVVGIAFGPRAGSLFLAFPAILPAALTLIQDHAGREKANEESWGAIAGAIGLAAFAVVVAAFIASLPGLVILVAALVAWSVVSIAVWALIQRVVTNRQNRSKQ